MKTKLIALLISLTTLGASGSLLAGGPCCSPGVGRGGQAANPVRLMLASYEKVSNALAADNLGEAKGAARTFLAVADTSAVKLSCGIEDEKCASKVKTAQEDCAVDAKGCTESLQALAEATTLEEARKHFRQVSIQAIRLAEEEEGYFVMTCPMAGENGDWLQTDKEIRNPYFGSKMLGCGTVKASTGAEATEG